MAKEPILYQELLDVVRSMGREEDLFPFFLSACEKKNLPICQICLDAGANINIRAGCHYETLLIMLVTRRTFTTEVGDWLSEKGADINIGDICGKTALTCACAQGDLEVAKYFINKGIKIRQYKDTQQSSDLYYAVCGENYEIVKKLIELGADLESNIWAEQNPFIKAVGQNLTEIVELFLQKGVEPNFYTHWGKTPLHIAVENNCTQTAKLLLKYKANVNAKLKGKSRFIEGDFALTPMDLAVLKQDRDMRTLLYAFGGTDSSKEEKIQNLAEGSDSGEELLMMKKILKS